ncbi:MAG TPA: recombinase family protein, partial [Polyangiaceae bacterium]|nr:recombinase family protein [Polyangiaceae bacterium]
TRMEGQELAGLTVAIYARFSSDGQREASIEDQIRRCRKYVDDRGGRIREELIFADRAVSGASMDRPQFALLTALATSTPPKVDVIVTEDLSRVGRDQADLHIFKRALEFGRVRLVGVADGIDTTAAHGDLTFAMKGMISQFYLKELRDKTMRGLEGRALAGYATGGVAYGYRLRRDVSAAGKAIGSRVEVDAEQAKVIRNIFTLYLDGYSYAGIAKRLNDTKVPPPRVNARNRRSGWKDTTIRAILRNESYAGVWTYKAREWRKMPGTNIRRYRSRDESEVIRRHYEDRRIVDEVLWKGVQDRLNAIYKSYARTKSGKPKGRALSSRYTPYLFSSLLFCGACGGKMVICGGSGGNNYYRCEAHNKRGTCKNDLSVRESVLRESLLDEIRHRLASDDGIRYARKRITEALAKLARESGETRREHRERMEKLEAQITRVVDCIAEGTGPAPALRDRLRVLEREADAERRAFATADAFASKPIKLPTPKEMIALIFDLDRRLMADVTRGREELRRFFRNGRIDLIPQPGRFYVARSEILPLVLLTQGEPDQNAGSVRYTGIGCAGRI